MKTELSFLSTQFRRIYNGDPWYGPPIQNVLQSFPAAHAFDRPAPEVHSAAELVAHILAYHHFLNNRLGKGDAYPPDQEATFDWKTIIRKQPDAWQALRDQLAHSQQQLLEALTQQEDGLLDEPVPGKSYDFRYLLYGIIQHDIYHLGQISYIRRYYMEADVAVQKSSFLPDLSGHTTKKVDSYIFFNYEGMSYSK